MGFHCVHISTALASTVNIETINSQQAFTNDPVFYGPDGKIITEEESSFLSGILTAATESHDDDEEYVAAFRSSCSVARLFTNTAVFSAYSDLDPGMDDEMKLAFKDFVKGYTKK